jgi:hypothetical protein
VANLGPEVKLVGYGISGSQEMTEPHRRRAGQSVQCLPDPEPRGVVPGHDPRPGGPERGVAGEGGPRVLLRPRHRSGDSRRCRRSPRRCCSSC